MAAPNGVSPRPYRGKRVVDLALVGVVAPVAAVVGAVAALLVAVTSRGPVLFRQARVGLDGHEFIVVKFRTMTHGDNPITGADDRITPVGRRLRRFSLDELPQLINVAKGEMSFVGPRPTLQYQVDRYTDRQHRRHDVKPGLTGWAQINGRNAIRWSERIELDLHYVEHQSVRLDLQIVVRTLGTLISGSGVDTSATNDPVSRSDP